MHREYFKGGESPFLEQIDIDLFFPGGNRSIILDEIKDAIEDDVAVITLVGEEGCGKSHLCQMVLKDCPERVCPVYLPETLESYEDVIRIVSQEMNISLREQDELGGIQNLLQEILKRLDEREQNLLILFDQAEHIYLATLERIRKMLDQANVERVRFQILLAGRNVLREHLQQLAMCSFEGTKERHLALEPLNVSETYAYLNYCIQGGGSEEVNEVFTREATEKIFSMAHGNFRMTNILAEESLQSLSADTSFLVLLDNVRDVENGEGSSKRSKVFVSKLTSQWPLLVAGLKKQLTASSAELKRRMPVSFKDLFEQKEWVIGAGGGLLLFLVLLVLVFSGSDEKEDTQSVSDGQVKVEYKQVADSPAIEATPLKEKPVKAEPLQEELAEDEKWNEKKISKAEMAEVLDKKSSPEGISKIPFEEEKVEPTPVIIEEDLLSEAVDAAEKESPPSEIQANTIQKKQADEEVVISEQDTETSVATIEEVPQDNIAVFPVEKEKATITIRVEPLASVGGEEKVPILGGEIVSKKVAKTASPSSSVDRIYARRIVASAKWWVGEQGGGYTVQLMVLTSDKAEENLKKMLMQKEYQDVADDLYILRRKSPPLTVLVFYGEFQTLEEARSASRNMPEFLRKHQPYALSVEGAVKKASSG